MRVARAICRFGALDLRCVRIAGDFLAKVCDASLCGGTAIFGIEHAARCFAVPVAETLGMSEIVSEVGRDSVRDDLGPEVFAEDFFAAGRPGGESPFHFWINVVDIGNARELVDGAFVKFYDGELREAEIVGSGHDFDLSDGKHILEDDALDAVSKREEEHEGRDSDDEPDGGDEKCLFVAKYILPDEMKDGHDTTKVRMCVKNKVAGRIARSAIGRRRGRMK